MKQILIGEDLIVPIDYDSLEYSAAIRQFRPTLYKQDEQFCCILGPDQEQAIYATGATEDEAIKNWNIAFKERMKSKAEDDEIAQYVRDTLTTSKNDTW